ncbi:transposase, partial [Candidatus Margulisiibacteriota bacterium]
MFIEKLLYCQKLKEFEIYGYKINPDHIHLLIQPNEKYDFSNIMGSLKRNFSRDCNRMMA